MGKPDLKAVPGGRRDARTQREIDRRAEEWLLRLILAEDPVQALAEGTGAERARRADLKVVR